MQFRVEEAVHRRQAVFDPVDQTCGHQNSVRVAKFHQPGIHRRVLDQGLIVLNVHLRHVAASVPGILIGGENGKLFVRGLGRLFLDPEMAVAVEDSPVRPGRRKFIGSHPDRMARLTPRARRSVGDVVAAAEAGQRQLVVDHRGVPSEKLRHHPAFDPSRKVGTGQGGGGEEKPGVMQGVVFHGPSEKSGVFSNSLPILPQGRLAAEVFLPIKIPTGPRSGELTWNVKRFNGR